MTKKIEPRSNATSPWLHAVGSERAPRAKMFRLLASIERSRLAKVARYRGADDPRLQLHTRLAQTYSANHANLDRNLPIPRQGCAVIYGFVRDGNLEPVACKAVKARHGRKKLAEAETDDTGYFELELAPSDDTIEVVVASSKSKTARASLYVLAEGDSVFIELTA